eukprot:TRINITY_DN15565_c0_g1_i1.p1 TRINITY_DN15565_c0_g1~~TRINITY_DN15565_c0_g1_i1.p1  ORF type:complete len:565 (+),score=116.07 TRINITY_DN15565_c0_g1_i1:73-1767(+)
MWFRVCPSHRLNHTTAYNIGIKVVRRTTSTTRPTCTSTRRTLDATTRSVKLLSSHSMRPGFVPRRLPSPRTSTSIYPIATMSSASSSSSSSTSSPFDTSPKEEGLTFSIRQQHYQQQAQQQAAGNDAFYTSGACRSGQLTSVMTTIATSPIDHTTDSSCTPTATPTTYTRTLKTPTLAFSTSVGYPTNLTPDLLSKLPPNNALHISIQHFLSTADVAGTSYGGLHGFLDLRDYFLLVTPRDPNVTSDLPVGKKGVAFDTSGGRRTITNPDYVKKAAALQPDLCASLSSPMHRYAGNNKRARVEQLSKEWLDECLSTAPPVSLSTSSSSSSSSTPSSSSTCTTTSYHTTSRVLATVIPCLRQDVRERICKGVASQHANVAGFNLCGFDQGETAEERYAWMKATVDLLPNDRLRFVTTEGSPVDVLRCVALGMDLICTPYVKHVTDLGQALTFHVPNGEEVPQSSDLDRVKIDLRDKKFQLDSGPIAEGCDCFTCTTHTRAYVNHLLNTHEILANILLSLHNHHYYSKFFSSVRESVARDSASEPGPSFESFCKEFLSVNYDEAQT